MARIETDSYTGIFEKGSGCCYLRFKFGSKIFEILLKCCSNVYFLQEIAFNHLVRAHYVVPIIT